MFFFNNDTALRKREKFDVGELNTLPVLLSFMNIQLIIDIDLKISMFDAFRIKAYSLKKF